MKDVFNEKPSIKYEETVTRVKYPAKIGKSLWCLFGKFSNGLDTKTITKEIKKPRFKMENKNSYNLV